MGQDRNGIHAQADGEEEQVKGYKVIKTKVVAAVTEARLYDETVEKVKAGHPEVPAELPSIIEAVTTAVENPTHVERSYDDSYVFVDKGTTNASGDPMRVPVKVVEGTSTRIKSFYFATTEDDQEIIWSRTDG